jgi:hypothetical protein
MKKATVILTSFLISSLFPSGVFGDVVWSEYNGHEYGLTSTWSNWQDAEAEAESYGGFLVTIDDESENSWLTEQFAGTYSRNGYGDSGLVLAWIGYHYNKDSSAWEWISGDTVNFYREDYPGWPDGGEHAYLHLSPHPSAGSWNANTLHDENFSYQIQGIMERSFDILPSVPEPSVGLLLSIGLAGLVCRKGRSEETC